MSPTVRTLADMQTTRVTVRLPETDWQALERLAKADRRTRSFVAREAIQEYLGRHNTEESAVHG